MMIDMKAIKPCTRRVFRANSMICKPPRRGSMSSEAYIAAHRAHKLRINLMDCENCLMATEEIPNRPKHSELPLISGITPLIRGKEDPIETPSETPQKPYTEPPMITPRGTLIYMRTHWDPPPAPPGWHRDDSDPETWHLVPNKAICKHLVMTPAEIGACGYHRVKRYCRLVNSFIGPTNCQKCDKGESCDGTW